MYFSGGKMIKRHRRFQQPPRSFWKDLPGLQTVRKRDAILGPSRRNGICCTLLGKAVVSIFVFLEGTENVSQGGYGLVCRSVLDKTNLSFLAGVGKSIFLKGQVLEQGGKNEKPSCGLQEGVNIVPMLTIAHLFPAPARSGAKRSVGQNPVLLPFRW
jgi:hypothetical protein